MYFTTDPTKNQLTIHLSIWNKLAAATLTDKTIPLSSISEIVARPPEAKNVFKGIKQGSDIPGIFTAGTYYRMSSEEGGKDFYYIRDPEKCLGLYLKTGSEFKAVYLHVDEPETPEEAKARLESQILVKDD
jgi:hypothetical protein